MADALSALVGIVAGGVLTGGVSQWADWRKRKRDLRTAARLVFADAKQCSTALDMALTTTDWWTDEFQPALEEWKQYRQDLAAAMSAAHLDTTQSSFRQMSFLARVRDGGNEPFDEWRDTVDDVKDAVDEAAAILLIYTRGRRKRLQ